jgi:hypothetical protein
MNTMTNFASLLTELSTPFPESRTQYKEWGDGRIIYDVTFPKLKFSMTVPMPEVAVMLAISEERPAFSASMPLEHAEAYVQSYKVRTVDALAYCLVSPHDVPQLRNLFGDRYEEADQLAHLWWEAAERA